MSTTARSRATESKVQQRQSLHPVKPRLKPTISSSKVGDARPSAAPLHEKKQGMKLSRVAELEAKLGDTLDELKKLREHLEAVESAKREVQLELEEIKKKIPVTACTNLKQVEEKKEKEHPTTTNSEVSATDEISTITDVFEVVPILIPMASGDSRDDNEAIEEEKKQLNKEVHRLMEENEKLKKEMTDVLDKAALVAANRATMDAELKERSESIERLDEQLEAAEGTKAALQEEMKRVCLRSDQWRKAAEAALVTLYGGEGKGAELEGAFMGLEDELGGGKLKGKFGDLWRKKGAHK